MQLVFYAAETTGTGELLWKLHHDLEAEYHGEFIRTTDDLIKKLSRSKVDQTIAVLLASNQKDLLDLFSMQNLLKDVRTILVLPDRSKDTVSKALKLLPRFFTYIDEDFGKVTAVLKKMLSNCHPVEGKGRW